MCANLDVEVVQRDNAINPARSHQIRDRVDKPAAVVEAVHREHIVARVPRPLLVKRRFDSKQVNGATFGLEPFQKPVAFEVAGETEKGEWHDDQDTSATK